MIIKNIVSEDEVKTCGLSKVYKNGVETSESFMERPKRVMIICGVHGDETAAISACYKYYKALKDNPVGHTSYKFIFLANENAVKNESREYQKPEEETKNLNRAFIEEEDRFPELKTRIIDEIKLFQPDVVLDVHNSPYCANTVLVDYGPKSQLIYFLAKTNKINPTLRPTTNFGTIKQWCLKQNIAAFTIEMGPMFSPNEAVIKRQAGYIAAVERVGIKLAHDMIEHPEMLNDVYRFGPEHCSRSLYSPCTGIIGWFKCEAEAERFREGIVRERGSIIGWIHNLEDDEQDIPIYAPEDLIMVDICAPNVVVEGQQILEYVPASPARCDTINESE